MCAAAQAVQAGDGYAFNVPSRTSNNQLYVPELDRIVLRDKSTLRKFADLNAVRKTTIMTRIMQLVYNVCAKGIHVTKRDLFYTVRAPRAARQEPSAAP